MAKRQSNWAERTQDITIDEVRELETFKNWSDERIEHLIRVINREERQQETNY